MRMTATAVVCTNYIIIFIYSYPIRSWLNLACWFQRDELGKINRNRTPEPPLTLRSLVFALLMLS